jgi:RHS repeat-associated protein
VGSPFDSLEVRGTVHNDTASPPEYPLTSENEVAYLSANGMRLARLHYEPPATGEPRLETSGALHAANLHVFLNLPDHLGSSSLIVDKATGELVEARTYQPFGGTESDYRPERWKGFREDYGFTGKEEDVEVGLQYFGKRYLSPYLGRWISPDPLAVHGPGEADLNLYAYVNGAILKLIDPLGLEPPTVTSGQPRNPALEWAAKGLAAAFRSGAAGITGAAAYAYSRARGDTDAQARMHMARVMTHTAGITDAVPLPIAKGSASQNVKAVNNNTGQPLPEVVPPTRATPAAAPVSAAEAPARLRPVNGKINVGGGLEKGSESASNLNPIVPGTGGPTRGIPNHVKAGAEQIAEVFEPGSASSITSARLPYSTVNWEAFGKGAGEVAAPGAKVMLNVWVQGDAAAQSAAKNRIAEAFKTGGFENVKVVGEGAGTIVTGNKPAAKDQ